MGKTERQDSTNHGAVGSTFDWSATPLGPLARWPPLQQDALRSTLSARIPMALWLGPQLLFCCNDAWHQLLGGASDATLGRPGASVFASRWEQIGPALRAAYATGQPAFLQGLPLSVERDGVAEEALFSWFISPLCDEQGQLFGLSTALSALPAPAPSGAVALARDDAARPVAVAGSIQSIAGRTATEDAVQASEIRLRTVIEATAQIIWTAWPDGAFKGRQESWERFTGQGPEEYADGGGFTAIHPDDRAAVLAQWLGAVAAGAPFKAEYRLRRHDGAYRQMRFRGTPLRGPDGAVAEWIGVGEDRTDQYQRERHLAFLDAISQELIGLADDRAIMRATSGTIAAYFAVRGCQFTEYDLPNDLALISYDWIDGSERSAGGEQYRISDFVARDAVARLAAGKQVVVEDSWTDPTTAAAAEQLAQLQIGTLVGTPYLGGGRWQAALTVHDAAPRRWRPDELELLCELSERIWSRVQRVRAEQALREREAQLAAFLEHSPGSLFVKDAQGRYQLVNGAFLTATGLAAEQVIGKTDAELFPPELATLFAAEDREVRASGEARRFEENFVYAGQAFTYLSQKFPLPGGGIGCVGTEITERRRAEEALRRQSDLTETVLQNSTACMLMMDARGYCTYMNRAGEAMFGWSFEEIRARPLHDLIHHHHPDGRPYPMEECPIDRALPENFDLREHEDVFIRRNGEFFPVLVAASPVFDPSGRPVSTVIEVRDVTERRRTEAALRQAAAEREQLLAQEQAARLEAEEASRLKDEFLATVSHELRTPLTAFLGYAELLKRRKRDEAYVEHTVEKMLRSAKAQAQLIEDLLDVSRIVSGRLRIEPAPVDLNGVVRAALDTVRPALEARQLRLQLQLPARAQIVIGDANRLQQVVWNLLANAVKFTPTGGTITVQLAERGGNARLSVADTGQGISPAFLPFVFDRFRQADGTAHRANGGLGLGLAIVRHLVELHGGDVQVQSDGLGQGATFTIRLPLASGDAAGIRAAERRDLPAADGDCPPALAGLRVLIVDDQPEILELLEEILASCGAAVRACGTAREALAAVGSWRPQVLVSDIAMPGEDGFWLIAQLRALPPEAGGATPAVALTAYARMEDRLRALAAGFEQYVPKPVEAAELLDVVARLARPPAAE